MPCQDRTWRTGGGSSWCASPQRQRYNLRMSGESFAFQSAEQFQTPDKKSIRISLKVVDY